MNFLWLKREKILWSRLLKSKHIRFVCNQTCQFQLIIWTINSGFLKGAVYIKPFDSFGK